MGTILIAVGGIAMFAGIGRLVLTVSRADRREFEREQGVWEAGTRQDPPSHFDGRA